MNSADGKRGMAAIARPGGTLGLEIAARGWMDRQKCATFCGISFVVFDVEIVFLHLDRWVSVGKGCSRSCGSDSPGPRRDVADLS